MTPTERQLASAGGTMVADAAPHSAGADRPDAEAEIKAYGLSVKIPLPKWAITAIAAVIVAALVGAGIYVASTSLFNRVAVPRELLSTYKEEDKHAREPKEQREENVVTFPDTTRVTLVHHSSDGCDQIVRWIPAKQSGESLWIFGPGLTPEKQNALRDAAFAGDLAAASPPPSIFDLVSRSSVADTARAVASATATSGGGNNCLNPHPGHFKEEAQAAGRCATKIWRYFDDGCFHYQMYNPCAGTWDVNANGSPRVYWQRCIH